MSRMQDKKDRHSTQEIFVGIDVGKEYFDICFHPSGEYMRVKNDKTGLGKLAKRCESLPVQLIALEATGKYHYAAHKALYEAGLDVAVINPYRSRKFADALGELAKTDKIDAGVLARYAAMLRPAPTQPPSDAHKKLRDLSVARRQVVDDHADLQRQLGTTDHPLVLKQMRARLAMCARHREALETEIKAMIKEHENLQQRFDILVSIPGVGPVTATAMLTELEELGQVNSKQIAALCGLAPMNCDSGVHRGKRSIRGGRAYVRKMLYLCAVCLARGNSVLGRLYKRLIEQGKRPKVALIAVARKLAVLANTLVSENRKWQAEAPPKNA